MSFEASFFDLDDTLYPATSGVWDAIGDRMDVYITEILGFAPADVKPLREKLFHEYGTTLRGLKTLYGIDEVKFLDYVHDIPLENFLQRDPSLASAISNYPGRKFIFTNANRAHAERVISLLGLDGLFSGIIDILQIQPYCKPLIEAYQKAVEISGISDARKCVVIDDSPRNLKTAQEMGFFTVQVGTRTCCAHANVAVLNVIDLPEVFFAKTETGSE